MRSVVSNGCDTFSTPSDDAAGRRLQLQHALERGRRQAQPRRQVDDVVAIAADAARAGDVAHVDGDGVAADRARGRPSRGRGEKASSRYAPVSDMRRTIDSSWSSLYGLVR